MKKIVAVCICLVAAQAAWAVPGIKIPKVPSGTPQASPAEAGQEGKAAGSSATIDALKQCCNEVRYSDTVKVSRASAETKLKGCTGSGWEFSKKGSDSKWYQKNWEGKPDGCLTVKLSCTEAGTYCDSCTVVPSSGMKSYCEPLK